MKLNAASLTVAIAVGVLAFSGCEKKGPAEKIGESIDNAAEEIKDAVKNDGPMEKVGESIDKAIEKHE